MVSIKVGKYAKRLSSPERLLLLKLLTHLIEEKIEFATCSPSKQYNTNQNTISEVSPSNSTQENIIEKKPLSVSTKIRSNGPFSSTDWLNGLKQKNGYLCIPGDIAAERDKAILLDVTGRGDLWVPKSQIKNSDDSIEGNGVWVKKWLIEKNLERIFKKQLITA